MTAFGWKRKIGQHVNKSKAVTFEAGSKGEEDLDLESGDIDWISLTKQRKVICLEDNTVKSQRLKQEGTTLAEAERYWEALRKWDEAIALTPQNETLFEMKAQVYLLLCELYPAITAAEKAVELNPRWWEGHQTLGRAHLGLGEVRMAIRSFSKAVHINPVDRDLWQEDLLWAVSLLMKKQETGKELEDITKQKIVELPEEPENSTEVKLYKKKQILTNEKTDAADININSGKLPSNYVLMRDAT